MKSRIVCGFGILWSLAVVGGCAPQGGPPKHLILIVVDTLRADVLGCFGGEATTPNIDRLAAEGVRFDQARSHIPITGPSHTSLFTSMLPHQHGVRNNTHLVPDDVELLASILERSGFDTTGVVSLGVLGSNFGFSRGFDRYDDQYEGRFWRDAAEVNEVALPLIKSHSRQRQFFWIHYSDPHSPYASPDADLPYVDFFVDGVFVAKARLDERGFSIPVELPPGETELEVRSSDSDVKRRVVLRRLEVCGEISSIEPRESVRRGNTRGSKNAFFGRTPLKMALINPGSEAVTGKFEGSIKFTPKPGDLHRLYRQEVEFADRQIGRLIATLQSTGLWEDSLVVFVADHGEGLGDSGRFAHVDHLYDQTLRVPLVLVSPGRLTPGAVVPTTVRVIDVMPTVLEILGVDPPSGMMGETLLPLLENPGNDRPSVAMTFQPQAKLDRRAVVSNGFKYIWTVESDDRELYDLSKDPFELENLIQEEPELAGVMHEDLLLALALDQADEFARPAELSQEEIEELEALGYVQ